MKKYDIRINYVNFLDKRVEIGWSAKNIGFGVLTISIDDIRKQQKFYVETECMGKDFYEQVMEEAKKYLLDKSEIIDYIGDDKE